jgi:predicted MPP superfamily phosphohydrolase
LPGKLRSAWFAVSRLPVAGAATFIVVAAILAHRVSQAAGAGSDVGLWMAATVIAFGLADWVLLAALPRLGLSFGPVGLPLCLITLVRLLVIVSVAWALRWTVSAWGWHAPADHPGVGLGIVWALDFGILACEIDGLYVGPFDVRVTHLSLESPCVTPGRSVRVVHLSDLHVERITKRERSVLDRVREVAPDVIVLTGDYLNGSYLDEPRARDEARWFLSRLSAPHGVFAVTAKRGDTPDAVEDMFGGLDIRVLRDEIEVVKVDGCDLALVGIAYLGAARDRKLLKHLAAAIPGGAYSVLLYHSPELALTAAGAGLDLYLTGHTHGGQIRLPLFGAVFTNLRSWKKYEQGLYKVAGMNLYVSRGLGMEGRGAPRARFLCRPEILAVDLTPA